MITMTEYQDIVRLRNSGKTHQEIANLVGISTRSVSRYLKQGKIPKYQREKLATRPDPLEGFYEIVNEQLEKNSNILLSELYQFLIEKGYQGSERTLRRKTADLRRLLKGKEVFFQRTVSPGQVMEGDFTEMYIDIQGTQRKVYLWVTSLPFSGTYFITPYYHCTFECFADGSVNAFNEFNGIAETYRLDNMSPAVKKILSGKDREVTARFRQFQNHYGFKQDFCNPGKGNEKGHIESNNKHIKQQLRSKISLHNLSFSSLDAFKAFVWSFCQEHNNRQAVVDKFNEEQLLSLNGEPFKSFRTTIAKINKFSLFTLDTSGHTYSVPSQYIGLSLEVRVYAAHVEVFYNGSPICCHTRIYGSKGIVSISVEHIIDGLLKKPGAVKDWKHRQILFERPAWIRFYNQLIEQGGTDKQYLSCLKLIKKYSRDIVTIAMELAADQKDYFTAPSLESLINNNMENIYDIKPLKTNLEQFDELLEGKTNGSQSKSKT